jgi:hypothetical protein
MDPGSNLYEPEFRNSRGFSSQNAGNLFRIAGYVRNVVHGCERSQEIS